PGQVRDVVDVEADVEVDLGAPEGHRVDLVLRGVGQVGGDLVGRRGAGGAVAGAAAAADQLLPGVVEREIHAVGGRPLAAHFGADADERARLVLESGEGSDVLAG